jgi:hypothetical protein
LTVYCPYSAKAGVGGSVGGSVGVAPTSGDSVGCEVGINSHGGLSAVQPTFVQVVPINVAFLSLSQFLYIRQLFLWFMKKNVHSSMSLQAS